MGVAWRMKLNTNTRPKATSPSGIHFRLLLHMYCLYNRSAETLPFCSMSADAELHPSQSFAGWHCRTGTVITASCHQTCSGSGDTRSSSRAKG